MAQKKLLLFSNRSSTKQFLLSKADAKTPSDKTGKKLFWSPDELSKVFPSILVGKPFIDHAMASLDSSSKFGTMVIRIDENIVSDNNHEVNIQIDVAKTIDAICQSENGIWGQLDSDLFGCFFPEKNDVYCFELAEKVKKNLAEHRNETVTIGIASYPAIDFKKHQILDNARKALDHAGFFGPDSMVVFDSVSLNISGD